MKGEVLKIEHMSLENGDGIRTTVYLKGCPLHCIWCHNPEGQEKKPQLMFSAEKCTLCRKCESACDKGLHSFDGGEHSVLTDSCDGCGKCASVCTQGVLAAVGKEIDASEVISEVMKDKIFYEKSRGGLTLSGGEPLFQPEFSLALCTLAKKAGLNVTIQTCGYGREEDLAALFPYCDTFMFDIKETDPALHREFTGVDNSLIMKNLAAVAQSGRRLILTCPLIPEKNDRDEHFAALAALAEKYHAERIVLHPYHPLGRSKLRRLGRAIGYDNPDFMSERAVSLAAEKISALTRVPVIYARG